MPVALSPLLETLLQNARHSLFGRPIELLVDEARLLNLGGVGVGEDKVVDVTSVAASMFEGRRNGRPSDGEVLAVAELLADEEISLTPLPVIVVGVHIPGFAALKNLERSHAWLISFRPTTYSALIA